MSLLENDRTWHKKNVMARSRAPTPFPPESVAGRRALNRLAMTVYGQADKLVGS